MRYRVLAIGALALPLALGACEGMQSGASTYDESAAEAGADFRYGARDAVAGLDPICPFTSEDERLAGYDTYRERMGALEDRIAGTALEIDLLAVRADYEHYWTVNDAECGPTDAENVAEQLEAEFAKIGAGLDRMEAAAGVN